MRFHVTVLPYGGGTHRWPPCVLAAQGAVALTTVGSSPQSARMMATPWTPTPIMAPVLEHTILPATDG